MRLWDIDPGYLNRQSLLGEHRELHGLVSIMVNNKKGYRKHPETIRWLPFGWGIAQRHRLLVAEMKLRGYQHHSPVRTRTQPECWPENYIDQPQDQFQILKEKYINKESGRIPLPKNGQQLWSHYKYSVMARSIPHYKAIGKSVAEMKKGDSVDLLAQQLVEIARQKPSEGGIRNALHHMWGYVSQYPPDLKVKSTQWSLKRLLLEIQTRTIKHDIIYLRHSTALGELQGWLW